MALSRRFRIALGASVLAHLALLAFGPRPPITRLTGTPGPMTVTLEESTPVAQPELPREQPPPPAPAPPPRPHSEPRKRLLTARAHTPPAAAPVVQPPPEPEPAPATPPKPAVDMLAMIRARRALRRAEEAAAEADSAGVPGAQLPTRDAREEALKRNLDSLNGDDRTGGIFQILSKSAFTAEFAFNGWQQDTQRHWREVIEVRAKAGEDIDLAIVRSMIALIRSHYNGDFLWDSRRLGRVVTLSARAEDNAALEQFLLREFFGTPLLKNDFR